MLKLVFIKTNVNKKKNVFDKLSRNLIHNIYLY